MARVLFVCLHNAGRSQMSEALFERHAGNRHEARSAGTRPGDRVHPEVVEAMAELGIDLATRVPRRLSREDAEWADIVSAQLFGFEGRFANRLSWVLAGVIGGTVAKDINPQRARLGLAPYRNAWDAIYDRGGRPILSAHPQLIRIPPDVKESTNRVSDSRRIIPSSMTWPRSLSSSA